MPRVLRIRTTPSRSRLMARVRQHGTAAEVAVREVVHRCGRRFRTRARDLPGTPDIVNRTKRWAVFVNGCFWHAHAGCSRSTIPKNNRAFWRKKFADNKRRDRQKKERLGELGYSVLTVWECELEDLAVLEQKVRAFLTAAEARSLVHDRSKHGKSVEDSGVARSAHPVEVYRLSASGKSAIRACRLPSGRTVTSVIRLGAPTLEGQSPQAAFDQAFLRRRTARTEPVGSHSVRVVDLFCGCGGLSLGAREACLATGRHFVAVAAVDWCSDCLGVYRRNFHPLRWHSCDINSLLDGDLGAVPTEKEREFAGDLGRVDLLLAGPPCQGNSDLNNHSRREDSRNGLYKRVARFVEIVHPQHVLIENVPTVVHGKERAVGRSVHTLRKLGYHVDHGTVDLASLGVPQRRKRHVLFASRSRLLAVSDISRRHRVGEERTVAWAISDLEDEPLKGTFTQPSAHTEENLSRIRFLHENGLYDLPNQLRPHCHRDADHSYRSMYGRLHHDAPAQTITSGFTSPGQGRYIHPARLRTLTPHEAARLQFFPDSFDFSSAEKRTALARMIGNAVPMKLSYVLCLELIG